jgi:hypothetical protein
MTSNARFAIGAAIVVVILGVVVSQFASSQPDGLEFVAEQEGFAETAEEHTLSETPLAGYGDRGPSRAIAAVVGIAATLGVGYLLFKVIGSKDVEPAPAQRDVRDDDDG